MADIIYMTRVQRERFSDPMEYEKVKNAYVLHDHMLTDTKPGMKITSSPSAGQRDQYRC
ncbi:MAG: hypothetical protein MZV63_08480 [Marinilabiliales bacterium]|nr:hypothetical protein [Marinilabiliales bacterium]